MKRWSQGQRTENAADRVVPEAEQAHDGAAKHSDHINNNKRRGGKQQQCCDRPLMPVPKVFQEYPSFQVTEWFGFSTLFPASTCLAPIGAARPAWCCQRKRPQNRAQQGQCHHSRDRSKTQFCARHTCPRFPCPTCRKIAAQQKNTTAPSAVVFFVKKEIENEKER